MLTVNPRKTRIINNVIKTTESVCLESENGIIRLIPINDEIVRISYTEKEFGNNQGNQFNGSVACTEWSLIEDEQEYLLVTNILIVHVAKDTGTITISDKIGNVVFAESGAESKIVEGFDSYRTIEDSSASVEKIQTADGVKRKVRDAAKVFYKRLYHTKLSLKFADDEIVYGLGQSPEGIWNLRGTTMYLHQANMKSPIPVMLSSKKYGIILSTKSPAVFNDNCYGTYISTHADEYLDYYFVMGDGRTVVKAMRYLSGKAAMLPKWAYGYIQSQERYESQMEIFETAKEFKDREFPVSALVLDWLSWPDNQWGQKSFDEIRFPNPKEMTDKLREMGMHLMVSIWPNMGEGGANNKEFKEKGLCLPNSNLYDCFSEEGRQLYWKQAKEGLFDNGVDGWWQDSSEPITPEWMHDREPDQAFMYYEFINEAVKIMPEDELNYFCINHGRALFDGQKNDKSGKRVLNLTRSGYPGSQKYGAVVWSGDISASWKTLARQVVAGMNYVATGMPYWNLDIGAFFVKKGEQWYWNGDFNLGTKDPEYVELFTRWFQYATFLPMMRCHGTDVRREPWNIAGDDSKTYNILLESARLRYKLLPYIYSTAFNACLNDESIISPLSYAYPDDEECYKIGTEFMLGSSLLVCPVISSKKDNGGYMDVYLPGDNIWYDLNSQYKFSGGSWAKIELSDEYIPVFVPAGSIIPMQNGDKMSLMVFKGKSAQTTIYNDCGDGYEYENGDYDTVEINYDDSVINTTISRNGKYAYEFDEIVYVG